MDEWEKFNEATLPGKEELCSNLNIEDITDADYRHAKRICKDFESKNLGEYNVCILTLTWVGFFGVRFEAGWV